MKRHGNTILVTGGSGGIGAALAQRWHDAGNTVIVTGRRQAALEEVTANRDNMHARTLDVDSADAIREFARAIVADFPALNVLVNNAGIMKLEEVGGERDLADAEATITTNLLGPIRLTDALVEHLKARGDGAIINVTSGLAFVPLTAAATYSATKAALHSYTASLRFELKGRVEVIELAPPGVQTDLTPGQATRDVYMPLEAFADEVMTLLAAEPTPAEVLVERVRPNRSAEREGRFDAQLETVSGGYRKMLAAERGAST